MADTTPTQYPGQGPGPGSIRHNPWKLCGLLLVVLVLKVLVVWQLKDQPLLHPDAGLDTTAYANLARRAAAGDIWLGPGLYFVAPLYIYFLAGALWLFESVTAARVLQVLLGTVSVGLIFLTTRRWYGERAAWISAILAALTGLFTFYESLILQASLDAVLTALGIWLVARGNAVAPGLVFALATLNRPNMIFGAGTIILAAFLLKQRRRAVMIAAGLLIGLVPSLARNVIVAGEWSLVSSHGGLNFYIGNNERATGFYHHVPGIRPLIEGQQEDARVVASKALGREVTDAEASAYFRDLSLSWIARHPLQAAGLFARKIYFTFHGQHVALPHSYPFFAFEMGTALQFLIVGPWLLVPLGLAGLALPIFFPVEFSRLAGTENSTGKNFLVWLAFVPGYAIGVALFFVAERYRMPLLVPLAIGAGGFIDFVWRRIAAHRASSLLAPLATVAVLAIAVNWPMRLNDGRWDDGLRTAQRLVITGHYDEADAWVERLERTAARPGAAHHGVGLQLVAQDQSERALKHLTRSLERGYAANDDVEMWLRLGRLSARTQSAAAAEPFFRRAVAIKPDQASARQQYGLNLLLLGRLDDARRELAEADRLEPGNADTLAHLAYCDVKLGRVDEARRHVRAALASAPDHQLARQLAAALGIG